MSPEAHNSKREAGPEVAEFEALAASFESAYPLAQLESIVCYTLDEALKHPVREPARLALIPISQKLNVLRKETNISDDTYKQLKEKYDKLAMAVGTINTLGEGNIIQHAEALSF